MTTAEAVWVVYGANVGTTTTAWIVAFLGLKVNIKTLALPFIAVAVWIRVAPRRAWRGFRRFRLVFPRRGDHAVRICRVGRPVFA
ncbi:hypothetical protein [Oceanidesulfovibrio indonesiensis]